MRLVSLSTIGQLPADAAASYERMRIHALRDGVDLRPTSAADAHRTRAQQERLFFERYVPWNTGTGDRRVYLGRAYWRRHGFASAAVPGTSNHGLEDPAALDLTGLGGLTGDGYRWLEENGADYGWVNPEWAKNPKGGATRELWHWEYSRTRDQHLNAGGGGSTVAPTPTPPTSEEDDDMPLTDADVQKIWAHKPTGNSTMAQLVVALKQRVVDGHAPSKPLAEIAGLPALIWGHKPTGVSTVGQLLAGVKQRVVDGHPGTKPLPEVEALRKEMVDGFAELRKSIEAKK